MYLKNKKIGLIKPIFECETKVHANLLGLFLFLWWIYVVTPQAKMDKTHEVLSKKINLNQDLWDNLSHAISLMKKIFQQTIQPDERQAFYPDSLNDLFKGTEKLGTQKNPQNLLWRLC